MAKDYWGRGTGFLTPRDPDGDAPAAERLSTEPTARDAKPKRSTFTLPRLPQALSRQKGAVALDELKVTARPKADAPGYFDARDARQPAFPELVRTVDFGRKVWFAVSFVAPLVIGGIYLFLIAPDEYVTEMRFSVRVPISAHAANNSAGAGSFDVVYGGNGPPTTDPLDNFTVTDYISSAQAARDLDAKVNLRAMFNKPSDPLSKLGEHPTAERLGKYWRKMVYANFDPATGLAVVRVNAYSAADSFAIASSLLSLSADVVNSIDTQSQQDSVRFAQGQYDRAVARVAGLRAELESFRLKSNVVNPERAEVSEDLQIVDQADHLRSQDLAQLDMLKRQLGNPQAPQILVLQKQIDGLTKQIAAARASGGALPGEPRMAITVGRFEDLTTKLNQAVSVQSSALQALSEEKTAAQAQRLYLATYVHPAKPEAPLAPQRWLDMLLILVSAAMVWVIGRMIGNSIMEHD